jgi:hypothetical protein
MDSPTSLIFGNGVIVDNPTPQNVVDAVSAVKSGHGNTLLAWSETGYALRVHVNNAEALCLELLSWKTGMWLTCEEPNLSAGLVVDSIVAMFSGDMNRVKQLAWVEPALPSRQAFQVGDHLYFPGGFGAMETMSIEEARAKLRRTRMIEWILWCLAAPVCALLDLAAFTSSSPNAVLGYFFMALVGVMAAGMHFVNWRCPVCGNALGPLPRRRCRCSWHEASQDGSQ